MYIRQIIDIIESVAPLSSQEHWDNSGLQIGSNEAQVQRVLLCTDVSERIIEEAHNRNCDLIISHHPLLFHGLKTIQGNTWQERCAILAIRYDIAIYSSHTAMDNYLHGVSGKMAEKIGVTDYQLLVKSGDEIGLGVIGDLPQPMEVNEMLQRVKSAFGAPVVRYTIGASNTIQRIALCGGAGSEFTNDAIQQGADCYISADFKHHEFQEASGRIVVMDIGHFESEQFTKEIFRDLIAKNAPQIDCIFAENDQSHVRVF